MWRWVRRAAAGVMELGAMWPFVAGKGRRAGLEEDGDFEWRRAK